MYINCHQQYSSIYLFFNRRTEDVKEFYKMTKTFSSSNSSRSPMPSTTRRGTYHCLPLSLDSDDSTLISYFRSGSGSPMSLTSPVLSDKFSFNYSRSGSSSSGSVRTPLSPLDNVKTAPAVADEEVLVIDGVLVSSSSSSNSSSSGNGVVYKKKMELCRSWEEFGRCRFASNCQFAHGKEELHPSYFPIKNKAMARTSKSYATRSSPYVPQCCILPPVMTGTVVAASQTSFSSIPECTNISPAVIKPMYSSNNSASPISAPDYFCRRQKYSDKSPTANTKSEDSNILTDTTTISDCWSPLDDGIQIALPSQTDKCTSKEEVDAYIHNVLYGPTTYKRLPVFDEFCTGR